MGSVCLLLPCIIKMDQVKDMLNQGKQKLEKFLENSEVMKKLEDKTKIPRDKLVTLVIGIVVFAVLVFSFQALLCNLFCFLIPAYLSYKCLNNNNEKHIRRCLTYWVIYSCVVMLESVLWVVLYFIPLWEVWRSIFMFYLFLPNNDMSEKIVSHGIRPLFSRWEESIDDLLRSTPVSVDDLLNKKPKSPPPGDKTTSNRRTLYNEAMDEDINRQSQKVY